jgi:hypothetical protein
MSSPASIAADFSNPVQYTVTALNQTAFKTYTVTVTVGPEPPASDVRAIIFFTFLGIDDVDTTAAISAVPDASGNYAVEVIIPAGNNLGSLRPLILYEGASIDGPGNLSEGVPAPYNPEQKGVIANNTVNFTYPQIYTVKAGNGHTSRYVVTVRVEDNGAKEITGFYFTSPPATGIIDEAAKTITVTVPSGTSLGGLVPTVYYTGASLDPASGAAVNFSSPVIYTVTARNGTAQPYTVRVIPRPASAKEITAVSFSGIGVLETVIGAAPNSGGYIPVSITVSGNTDISALRPTITHTGASITPPGGTPQTAKTFTDAARHFGSPQVYTVTAEDGTVKDYAVSVHVSGGGARIITGFVFNSVPLTPSGTVSVTGQIDQDTYTIEVRVPHNANISGTLAPTITYLGKSAAYTGTSTGGSPLNQNTAPSGKGNTYTDAPRDFSGSAAAPLYYTVTMADPPPDDTQEYTVKVVKIPEVTVSYEALRDDKFVEESFDQRTGQLTISIITTASTFPLSSPSYGYKAPFDWYIDGVKQPLAGTQRALVIKTTDFKPGRHQVTVSAARTSDNRHYTNALYFDVQE